MSDGADRSRGPNGARGARRTFSHHEGRRKLRAAREASAELEPGDATSHDRGAGLVGHSVEVVGKSG
jgi:hypothetical protein